MIHTILIRKARDLALPALDDTWEGSPDRDRVSPGREMGEADELAGTLH